MHHGCDGSEHICWCVSSVGWANPSLSAGFPPTVARMIGGDRFFPLWILDPSIKIEKGEQLSQGKRWPYYCCAPENGICPSLKTMVLGTISLAHRLEVFHKSYTRFVQSWQAFFLSGPGTTIETPFLWVKCNNSCEENSHLEPLKIKLNSKGKREKIKAGEK